MIVAARSLKHDIIAIKERKVCRSCSKPDPRGRCAGGGWATDEQKADVLRAAGIHLPDYFSHREFLRELHRATTQTSAIEPVEAKKPGRFKCRNVEYRTPKYVVDAVRASFGGVISLDPCTMADNPCGATKFHTKETNGLDKPFVDRTFVNPPYGPWFEEWVRKCGSEAESGMRLAVLLPCGARFSTLYFHEAVMTQHLTCQVVFDHRLAFSGMKNNQYDSILWCYNVPVQDLVAPFRGIAKVVGCVVMP